MHYRPPTNTIYNGCGPTALAAILGGAPEEYLRYNKATPCHQMASNGQFSLPVGMMTTDIKNAILSNGHTFTCDYIARLSFKRLSPILHKRGIAIIGSYKHTHAVAFYHGLVYDAFTFGRWQWYQDYELRKNHCKQLIFIERLSNDFKSSAA